MQAHGLNNAGQVVGTIDSGGGARQAALWTLGHISTSIMPFATGAATAINDAGQVVGGASTGSGRFAPIINGIEVGYNGEAYDINNLGSVVGTVETPGTNFHAGMWNTTTLTPLDTRAVDLGTLPGSPYLRSQANSISDNGIVVGWSETYPNTYSVRQHAVSWTQGTIRDLGILGDPPFSAGTSQAFGVNDQGQVVGTSTTADPELVWAAVLWVGGKIQDLGHLQGAYESKANKINTLGQIVGNSGMHAVLWSNGDLLDLNKLVPGLTGWILEDAVDINDLGQIVVNAVKQEGGASGAFLLTPTSVPEPGSLLLLAIGLPGLLYVIRQQRR